MPESDRPSPRVVEEDNVSRVLRQTVVGRGGIKFGDYNIASGDPSNIKIDMDVIRNTIVSRAMMVNQMARLLVVGGGADLLIGPDHGDQEWALAVGAHTDTKVALNDKVNKTPGSIEFALRGEEDAELVRSAGRLAMVMDVTTRCSSFFALTQAMGREPDLLIVGWRRGMPEIEPELPCPILSVINCRIPLLIPEEFQARALQSLAS